MKRVLFKKWIPAEYNHENGLSKKIDGTGCMEKDFTHRGLFHQWGINYEESDKGFGQYTVALVQVEDGTIEQVQSSDIKFID